MRTIILVMLVLMCVTAPAFAQPERAESKSVGTSKGPLVVIQTDKTGRPLSGYVCRSSGSSGYDWSCLSLARQLKYPQRSSTSVYLEFPEQAPFTLVPASGSKAAGAESLQTTRAANFADGCSFWPMADYVDQGLEEPKDDEPQTRSTN